MYTDKATESKRRPFVRVYVEVMATDELPEQVSINVDDTLNLKSKSVPIGGDYLDEGFQLSKSAMKKLRKSKRKSEKEMREAEVREPPSKEKYSYSARGQTGRSFNSIKSRATTHQAGGHGSKAKKLNV
ncbi:hypothetical protein GIB67_001472 [Kingdonia uniflora]|uniref:Uncharacterized protein n=1 Tax=Kingdonia uniflora TaxID=39325 RepID=A0A7J7LMP0_9MAGN|nr:hypothetical protein GIB67_001472 [Kingdonia uniflora]